MVSVSLIEESPPELDDLGEIQIKPFDPAIIEAIEAGVEPAADANHDAIRGFFEEVQKISVELPRP